MYPSFTVRRAIVGWLGCTCGCAAPARATSRRERQQRRLARIQAGDLPRRRSCSVWLWGGRLCRFRVVEVRRARSRCPARPATAAAPIPGVTSRSRASSSIPSPQANCPAACSRSRSGRAVQRGVYPPRCAYRMPRSYARNQPPSRP